MIKTDKIKFVRSFVISLFFKFQIQNCSLIRFNYYGFGFDSLET